MANPWFDEDFYLADKLAKHNPDEFANVEELKAAIEAAGLTPEQHFELYGAEEGTSPNALFNVEEYLANKAARDEKTVEQVRADFQAAGLSAWAHFLAYGWEEGVNPSNAFDIEAYFADKAERDGKTVEEVKADFKAAGVDPITHATLYAETEGLEIKPAAGGTSTLTEALAALQAADKSVVEAAQALNEELEPETEYTADAAGVENARADAQDAVDSANAALSELIYQIVGSEDVDADLNEALLAGGLAEGQALTKANLNKAKAGIQAQIDADDEETGAAELQTALLTAEAELNAARGGVESDADVLAGMRDAINAYLGAGGDNIGEPGADLFALRERINLKLNEEDGYVDTLSGESYGNGSDLLAAMLGAPDVVVTVEDGVATVTATEENEPTAGQGTWVKGDPVEGSTTEFVYTYQPTAEEQALVDSIDATAERIELISEVNTATEAFKENDLGNQLTLIDARLDEVATAEENVADAQAAQIEANGLIDALEAALAEQADAKQWFEDNEYVLPKSIDGAATATEESDIFLFADEAGTITGFGLDGDDVLYAGQGFTWSVLEAEANLETERLGEPDVLEIFAQQVGNNVVLSFEQQEFAGNALNLDDIVQVTLTGVSVDEIALNADGVIAFV